MKLLIPKAEFSLSVEFAKDYLPDFIQRMCTKSVSAQKMHDLTAATGIDFSSGLKFAISQIQTSEDVRYYIIEPSAAGKCNGYDANWYINVYTYGTLDVKGSPEIYDTFKLVSENLSEIYREWLGGN